MKEQAGRADESPLLSQVENLISCRFSLQPSISPSQIHQHSGAHGRLRAPDYESRSWQRCVVMDFREAGGGGGGGWGEGWTPVWPALLKRRESDDNFKRKYKKQSVVLLIFQSTRALWNQRQWNEIWVLSNLKIDRKEMLLSVPASLTLLVC